LAKIVIKNTKLIGFLTGAKDGALSLDDTLIDKMLINTPFIYLSQLKVFRIKSFVSSIDGSSTN